MPKPSYVPVWAEDLVYDSGPEIGEDTKVASVEGPTQGWRPAAEPPAEEFNEWMNWVGQWCDYLDGGVLEGNHIIQGDLTLDGGSLTADVNVTVGADLTVTGEIHHANMVLAIPGSAGIVIDSGSWYPGISVNTGTGIANGDYNYPNAGYLGSIQATANRTIIYNIPLRVGDRIKDVRAKVKSTAGTEDIDVRAKVKSTAGTEDITSMDVFIVSNGTLTSIGTTSDVPCSATLHALTPTVTDTTINNVDVVVLVGFVVEAGIHISSLNVTYDRP